MGHIASNMMVTLYSLCKVDYMYIKIFIYICDIYLNLEQFYECMRSENNSGLRGIIIKNPGP